MIQVICADFKSLPLDVFDGVDHGIFDPPYSGHTHANATSTGNNGRGPVERDFGFPPLSSEDRERALKIITRFPRWSIVFSDFAKGSDEVGDDDPEAQAQAGHMVLEGDCAWRVLGVHMGLEWIRLVPWIRWSQPQITGDRPCTGAEAVLHFHGKDGRKPRRKRWNGPGGLTHYARTSLRGKDKHPTEKPLDLMLDLVSWYTEPGEAIADLFAGAGTTGQAARLLGRDAILIERIPEWADKASARVVEPFSERDLAAVVGWIESTIAEANETKRDPTSTEGAIRRADHRLADAERAFRCIEAA